MVVYFNRLRSNHDWRSIFNVSQIHNSFPWHGTTVYFPVSWFLSIQWLPFRWCSTNQCFFNNLINSSGLILPLGILFSIIKWNSFFLYIFLHSFEIALYRFFYISLKLIQSLSCRKTSWQFYHFCIEAFIFFLRYFYRKFSCSHDTGIRIKMILSSSYTDFSHFFKSLSLSFPLPPGDGYSPFPPPPPCGTLFHRGGIIFFYFRVEKFPPLF